MDRMSIIQLVCVGCLVIMSAFFSSAETALTTISPLKLKSMAEEGDKGAKRALKVIERYSRMLSTILVGNNIVNIAASALATSATIRIAGNYAVGIVTGILTLVVLILGEIIPKTIAKAHNQKLAFLYAPVLEFLMNILVPIVYIVETISAIILKLFKIDVSDGEVKITENELKTYVDVSHEGGDIESEEREIIYNVFDFSDMAAKDIMIPRIDMVTASSETTYQEMLDIFRESMFTRIPVYEGDSDNIIGLVNIKDFILVKDETEFDIKKILRRPFFTYEVKKIADLMVEMRKQAINIAFVLSEYGNTVGMITMEDLLEEIVGEIRDEYDTDEDELVKKMSENHYLVEGSLKLVDLNDALGTQLDSADYESVGGLMIEKLSRLPEDGEKVELGDGIVLTAQGINNHRIVNVLVTTPTKKDEEENSEEEKSV